MSDDGMNISSAEFSECNRPNTYNLYPQYSIHAVECRPIGIYIILIAAAPPPLHFSIKLKALYLLYVEPTNS